MEKKFSCIEDVKQLFSISDDNLEEIEKKLKKLLVENHPDKTDGDFTNKEQEDKYYLINQAIEFIRNEKQNNTQLVPISVFNSLVEILKENKNTEIKKDNYEIIQTSINSEIKKIPTQNLMPKISLSTITTVITMIWLFPNTINEHPVLSKLINTEGITFTIVWLYLLLFTACFWILTALKENKQKKYLESLNTEQVQDLLFQAFLTSCSHRFFYKSDFIEYITYIPYYKTTDFKEYYKYKHRNVHLPISKKEKIPSSLAEPVANQIIGTALKRNIIEEIDSNRLSPKYRIKDFIV